MTRGRYEVTNELVSRKAGAVLGHVDDDALEFQPDSVEIDRRKLPQAAYVLLWTSASLLFIAFFWSAWANVDRTVSANGKIVSQSPAIVKQPFQASVIRNLNFRAGERVTKGDIIVRLDQTVTSVDREQLIVQLGSRKSELVRIEAEVDGRSLPDEDLGPGYAAQRALLQQRRMEFDATIQRFAARHELLQSQQRIANAQEAQSIAQLSLARERLQRVEQLVKDGVQSQTELTLALSEVARLEAAKREKAEEQTRYLAEMTVLDRELALYKVNFVQPLFERRIVLQNEIAQLEIQIARAKRISELLDFPALADGVLMDVTNKSIGSVVEPAEVLFTLVPTDKGLDLELEVTARDAGWIHIGQPVRIKLDPFPFQRHGTLDGSITAISPDAFQRQIAGQTQIYFRVRVGIHEESDLNGKLRNLPEDFKLAPGITAVGEILIGPRTVLSYITDPIHKALDESLGEAF